MVVCLLACFDAWLLRCLDACLLALHVVYVVSVYIYSICRVLCLLPECVLVLCCCVVLLCSCLYCVPVYVYVCLYSTVHVLVCVTVYCAVNMSLCGCGCVIFLNNQLLYSTEYDIVCEINVNHYLTELKKI